MSDGDLLSRLDENVKYIRKGMDDFKEKLDDHIEKDEQDKKEYLLPIYNDFQQRQGAQRNRDTTGKLAGYCINAGIAIAAAFAAVKAIK